MEFNIVDKLLGMTLLGAEWVLWLLLILSVVSIAIMIERVVFYVSTRIDYGPFSKDLSDALASQDVEKAKKLCKESESLEARTALTGLENHSRGVKAMEGSMEGFIVSEKQRLDKGLVVLGTLGNNAPFIGLFGTVIGIIQAFNDLANSPEGGPSVVMGGISEALVATAVGLLVAIPAVIAFNAFNKIVKARYANAQSVSRIIVNFQNS